MLLRSHIFEWDVIIISSHIQLVKVNEVIIINNNTVHLINDNNLTMLLIFHVPFMLYL